VSREKPQRSPYNAKSWRRKESGSRSVAHNKTAASNAEREVSQIHSKGKITPLGKIAQSHEENTAIARRAGCDFIVKNFDDFIQVGDFQQGPHA
jgi:hypothetical protein